jgi:hypothetical protein
MLCIRKRVTNGRDKEMISIKYFCNNTITLFSGEHKMKKSSNSLCLVVLLSLSSVLYGWENIFTHPAITEQ